MESTYNPPVPSLQFLARFEVELGSLIELGDTGTGKKRIIPINGGRFEGPNFKGSILPGGADWQLVQNNGVARIDTRYHLKTDDGAILTIATQGVRHGPPEVITALAKGKKVDPARYYFRFNIRFETGASKYAWLNRSIAVGSGMRLANAVIYDAYVLI